MLRLAGVSACLPVSVALQAASGSVVSCLGSFISSFTLASLTSLSFPSPVA